MRHCFKTGQFPVTGITQLRARFKCQSGLIGGVGIMALRAGPLGHRSMYQLFSRDLRMAFQADRSRLAPQQTRLVGAVPAMTGAAVAASQGSMNMSLAPGRAGVTAQTQLRTCCWEQVRMRGKMGIVAGNTLACGNGGMNNPDFGLLISVAQTTVVGAGGRQQTLFIARMCIMTAEASLLHQNRVKPARRATGVLVALKTQSIADRAQQVGVIALMGIVATGAVLLSRSVNQCFALLLIVMTAETKRLALPHQRKASLGPWVERSGRPMAIGAGPLCQGPVDMRGLAHTGMTGSGDTAIGGKSVGE